MHFIDHEIAEVSKRCHNVVPHSKLITCHTELVRVNIQHTPYHQLSVILRFPSVVDDYPHRAPLLVELKSKTLSTQLLQGLTALCERRARELLGRAQIIDVLQCCHKYLDENPLCIVFAEVTNIKALLLACSGSQTSELGELKLRQKQSIIALVARGGSYEFRVKVHVPPDYPVSCISWQEHTSNLPIVLQRFLSGQAREIARQCVEPPLRPAAATAPPFQPRISLERTFSFLIEALRDFPAELCPVCRVTCLPSAAADVVTDDSVDAYVERVLCGHLFHQGCLKRYMREPPFPPGGKCCPAPRKHPRADLRSFGPAPSASTAGRTVGRRTRTDDDDTAASCGIRLSHDRWGLSVKLAEARWAQQQAREREFEEVRDFMQ